MNNRETDGYIIVDMKGIDVSRASQSVPGLYEKVSPVLDANKLVIVNNAGNHTPLPGSCIKSSNYIRITTDIYIFTINSNNILIIEANGSSITVDVSIVPTYAEGTKVADFEINGQSGEIYIPAYPDIINDSTASDHTVYSSDKVNTLLSGKADTNSIPTKTSDLQNDSGFITSSDIPAIPDELNDLDDVAISSATDSQVLTFDAISGKWVNATSPSGVTELSQLSDVTVASIADGEVLTYDSTSSKWKNEALPAIPDDLTDLSDIAITSASNGEVLTYDATSSKWVNADIFDAPSETITASDTIVFNDISDSNKPKSTTAAAVAGLALDRLKIKTIPITGSGTLWSGHYYYDADISSSFTGDESTAIIIGIMSGTATNGGILQLMKQGDRTIRLLDSQAFTNVTVNALVLYYVP